MPCHNVKEEIPAALDSLLTQTRLDDMLIVPVDDGSTDGTATTIQDFADRYPQHIRPIYLDEASGGPGAPRNAGLDIVETPYVIFMDPDDRVYRDGYSRLLSAAEHLDSDLVIGTRYGVHQGSERPLWADFIVDEPWVNSGSYEVKLRLLRERPFILKSIYSTDHIARHGLRFIAGLKSSEDEIFDMKFALLSNRISKINDVVYLYTVSRPGSITSKVTLDLYRDLPIVMAGLRDALSVYFSEEIVSFRIASLLDTFYLPKLSLVPEEQVDDALRLMRAACEDYGFDRLLLTEKLRDRETLAALRDERFAQLWTQNLRRTNRQLRRKLRQARAQVDQAPTGRALRPARLASASNRLQSMRRTIAREVAHARRGTLQQYHLANSKGPGLVAKSNPYWVFMDRRDRAGDNAEVLYKYVRDQGIHDRLKFILAPDSPDVDRLRSQGFDLVDYNSLEHWELLHGADRFFTSHVDEVVVRPWREFGPGIADPRYRLEFLQHGVITSDLSGWLGHKRFDRFYVSARPEYQRILNNIDYGVGPETLRLTGLARHDQLSRTRAGYLLVAPTWRSSLHGASEQSFLDSDFYAAWSAFLTSPRLDDILQKRGLDVVFMLHKDMQAFSHHLPSRPRVRRVDFDRIEDFSSLVSGAQIAITDFSSMVFDAAYIEIPCIFYRFAESSAHTTEIGRDYSVHSAIGHLAHDLESALDGIDDCAEREYVMTPPQVEATRDFFAFDDRGNCTRIIDSLE